MVLELPPVWWQIVTLSSFAAAAGLQRSETASATTGALAMSTSTSDATTSASGATRSRGCGGNADG